MDAPQSWLQRVLGWAITFVVIALLVHWGWDLLLPVVPYLAGGAAIVVIGGVILRYRHNRYW